MIRKQCQPTASASLKINQIYTYTYLSEASLFINLSYLSLEKFSSVHKSGKNNIILSKIVVPSDYTLANNVSQKMDRQKLLIFYKYIFQSYPTLSFTSITQSNMSHLQPDILNPLLLITCYRHDPL